MSCQQCETDGHPYPFRWKNANVLIVGCRDHVVEIMNALREAQAATDQKDATDDRG